MTQQTAPFALQARDVEQPSPVLRGVECSCRLQGVLFESTLRQRYRNDSPRNLEVVYTFPKAAQAVLLGFASELNGMRQEGVIVARRQAETQYEAALAEGDAPVMLEEGAAGLYTANIGNLKPGDEVVIELRTAQVLQFEQGRLRLSLPTTIAPRYGSPDAAGLQPQQVPVSSVLAEYPLALRVEIRGALAAAQVECPTHRFQREATEGVLCLTLDASARLDRDAVITVQPEAGYTSVLCQAADAQAADAPCVWMAAFLPRAAQRRASIALKVLVDCSGSMAGDSMHSAKIALCSLVRQLGEGDTLSISRFGTTVEHVIQASALRPAARRSALQTVQRIEADMGGTEMESALGAVFQLPVTLPSRSQQSSTDVLLLTDGEIWQTESVIRRARDSGHRVFAIGLGSSPAEPLLRGLAEATGGACEFATPGEALEAAAERMLDRIRQVPLTSPRIDWGDEPIWQTPLPLNAFDGDTLIAFAGFAKTPARALARLLALDTKSVRSAQQRQIEVARCEEWGETAGTDSLARLAAARRMHGAADDSSATALAVRYQLMSPHTNCILVHDRVAAEKASQAAELHRVSGMHAAGAAGVGGGMHIRAFARSAPRELFAPGADTDGLWNLSSPRSGTSRRFRTVPHSFAETSVRYHARVPACLRDLAEAVRDCLIANDNAQGLADDFAGHFLHPDLRAVLDALTRIGLSADESWLALARWVYRRDGSALPFALSGLPVRDAALEQAAMQEFERRLSNYELDSWLTKRQSRLAQRMQDVGR